MWVLIMDINNIIDDVITAKKPQNMPDSSADQNIYADIPLSELLLMDLYNEDICIEIYNRFKADIESYIDSFMESCKDTHAPDGMYKCSFETWQCCAHDIGMNYFNKNKYLRDVKRIRAGGGQYFKSELLTIGILLYEDLCNKYRKQFFIYDCCRFLGMSLDTMYDLNNLHTDILKKAHTIQESSLRSGLVSGRSNVTALAILLNHDYNYTKTTEIIHHSDSGDKSADKLPDLSQNVAFIDDKM